MSNVRVEELKNPRIIINYLKENRGGPKLNEDQKNKIIKVLKGNPEYAWEFCEAINEIVPELEETILNDLEKAYLYCYYKLKRSWKEFEEKIIELGDHEIAVQYLEENRNCYYRKELEEVILTDPLSTSVSVVTYFKRFPSLCYLKYKDNIERFEDIISKDGYASKIYASHILKRRFKLGEISILKRIKTFTGSEGSYSEYLFGPSGRRYPRYHLEYIECIIQDAFFDNPKDPNHEKISKLEPELEDIISKDSAMSYSYACYCLKSRFPSGEPAIFKDPMEAGYYANKFAIDIPEEVEDIIKKAPRPYFDYQKGRYRILKNIVDLLFPFFYFSRLEMSRGEMYEMFGECWGKNKYYGF